MDFFVIVIILVVIFIVFSVCGWCCKRAKTNGTIITTVPGGVTVSSTHVAASQVAVPPYPTGVPLHPAPNAGPPPPGFHAPTPYPPAGPVFPPGPGGHAPYPPAPYPPTSAAPYPPQTPPYPPASGAPYPTGGTYQNPPSYNEAVAQPPVTHEVYSKQAPYNPNY